MVGQASTFRKLRNQKTKYQILNRKVSLSKLQVMRSMVYLFKYRAALFWPPLKHLNHLTLQYRLYTRICLHFSYHGGEF